MEPATVVTSATSIGPPKLEKSASESVMFFVPAVALARTLSLSVINVPVQVIFEVAVVLFQAMV